ncbi:MAG: DUF4827 domain-containing protein [Prevotella sp.]|nr:DUF4827 domain-containing protein [Prevotella sp.]
MRKFFSLLATALLIAGFSSCNDGETYQEKRDKEIVAINSYIAEKNVKVISEEQFFAQDSMTDVKKNEYVLFEASGVYMQIERKGCGQKLRDGETASVLCRFTEYNLMLGGDSISLTNNAGGYSANVDKMIVTNTSGTFSGNFDTSSRMYMAYGYSAGSAYTSLPSGWLVPFGYINLGRPAKEGDETAKVRIIVPHKQGHLTASNYVTPYLYELTLERGR